MPTFKYIHILYIYTCIPYKSNRIWHSGKLIPSIEKSSSSMNLYSKHIQQRAIDFIADNNKNYALTQPFGVVCVCMYGKYICI